jgi:predicted nucleic acid-binding protein
MPFVLDASVALAWAFADEDDPRATAALARFRSDEALVPGIWWFEVRSALVVNERRGRLTEADTGAFLRTLARLTVTIDRQPGDAEVLALARQHRLSVYDASYLELARRDSLPLATLDRDLIGAARAERVPLVGEASV